MKNGTKPLIMNYETFIKATRLNYGNLVKHPQIEDVKAKLVLLGGNKSSTDQLNSTRLNEVPRKKHMSYPRFIACVLEEKLAAKYAQDPSLGSTPWILSNPNYSRNPSEVTLVDLTTYMLRVVEQAKKSPTFSMEK
ncbi:hypothetical protein Tco_0212481 [Tanacetum coccineum]